MARTLLRAGSAERWLHTDEGCAVLQRKAGEFGQLIEGDSRQALGMMVGVESLRSRRPEELLARATAWRVTIAAFQDAARAER